MKFSKNYIAFLETLAYNRGKIDQLFRERMIFVTPYNCMSRQELEKAYDVALQDFEYCRQKKLSLNISRGKPSTAQLNLVTDLLTIVAQPEDCFADDVDARNYGELSGLQCAKDYWADILGCRSSEVFVGGGSSLTLMYDVIAKAYTHGFHTSPRPWSQESRIKFLCPSPGYDRHFKITESFGAELITVPMTPNGPDMDMVEELVKDPMVKGIWCVPKYSNPDGIIYSDETIHRFANLHPAAPDFIIMWDNAYCIHEFEGDYVPFPDIISLCREAGNPNMVFEFASTSKVTFPGSGISCLVSSEQNIAYMTMLMSIQMISYNKLNQLRHVRYLKDKAHTLELMKRHAEIMAPKFRLVSDILDEQIKPLQFANWIRPKGGYFVSFNTMQGTAKRALELCKQAGLTMTPAGATFPYGVDPNDSNIRIAPSLPPLDELEAAMGVFCTCLKLAALEKLLAEN